MELSGTVHLNEASNNRYQFIYGSIKDATFFGVYAQFTVENKTLKKVTVRSVNYNVNSRLGVKWILVDTGIITRSGTDYGSRNAEEISIDCIHLYLEMGTVAEGELPNLSSRDLNIPLTGDLYLEVTRKPDQKDGHAPDEDAKIEECKDSFMPNGEKLVHTAPGGLCPRGFNKIIIS